MIKYLENENLNDVIKDGIWIVDFYADWCAPCKMLGNNLEKVDVNVLKINVDTHEEIAQEFGVMSIPTICYYKDGEMIKKTIGYRTKVELDEMIESMK